ncbi:PepSY domain-containing protein [Gymnodinialimonas hymeniacidonis]|uniref:PepSY domain-containing protein n=1 Tax=Gymnodinialimonas hymeniacidonis TaxID=3126508 RepID=UPI0034C666EB
MKTTTKAAILALITAPTVAFAQLTPGDVAGTAEADILAFLEAEGYTIQETETEGDMLEVEVMLDGAEFEIEVDLTTGRIAEIEAEDDDDDADDDDA